MSHNSLAIRKYIVFSTDKEESFISSARILGLIYVLTRKLYAITVLCETGFVITFLGSPNFDN